MNESGETDLVVMCQYRGETKYAAYHVLRTKIPQSRQTSYLT